MSRREIDGGQGTEKRSMHEYPIAISGSPVGQLIFDRTLEIVAHLEQADRQYAADQIHDPADDVVIASLHGAYNFGERLLRDAFPLGGQAEDSVVWTRLIYEEAQARGVIQKRATRHTAARRVEL